MARNNDYSDVTIVVPTFNEEGNIGRLISIITKLFLGISIIVADDGSKDKTQPIVSQWNKKNRKVMLLNRAKEPVHGLTISVADGICNAETEYSVVIDADLQHPPDKIKELVEKLRAGADVVIGSRSGVPKEWGASRRIISWGGTMLGNVRLWVSGAPRQIKLGPISCAKALFRGRYDADIMSGFFGTRTELFRGIYQKKTPSFVPQGYKVLFDFLKLLHANTKIDTVFYEFGLRTAGESKIGSKHFKAMMKSLIR